MAIDGVDQTHAQEVLALISRDSGVREIFVAAYRGQGDALDLLRRAANDMAPAVPETLNALHRQAFSRTHTPAEENAARAALADLTAAKAVQTADSDALRAAIVAAEEWATSRISAEASNGPALSSNPGAMVRTEPVPEVRRFALRPLVLACVVLGSMAIGAALAVALWTNPVTGGSTHSGSPESTASPTQTVTNVAQGTNAVDYGGIVSTGQGNYGAAAQWFHKPAKSSDTFPGADLIEGLTASSTRLVGDTPRQLKVWVGKTDDDRLCLIMTVPSTQGAIESVNSCANAQQFDAMGLGLHAGGYQVIWMGQTVSVFSKFVPSD